MKTPTLPVAFATLCCAVLLQPAASHAQSPPGSPAPAAESALLTPEQLLDLVGPIALYPDDLIALVIPVSTTPLDIVKAQRLQGFQLGGRHLGHQAYPISGYLIDRLNAP